MSIRAVRLFCLFFLLLGSGCRNPITPPDNNQAPETWITSAPQDTITTRNGRPIQSPPGTIPVQYHLYWAGSDVDGAVATWQKALKLDPNPENKQLIEHLIAEAKQQPKGVAITGVKG